MSRRSDLLLYVGEECPFCGSTEGFVDWGMPRSFCPVCHAVCTDMERIAHLGDRPADCACCSKRAHVTLEERARGRWTCYGCGRVNDWHATRLTESD